MNSFGTLFRITTFGESHGPSIGVVIDGCPSGHTINMDELAQELKRRRPGQSSISTPRKEKDEVQILSGVYNGRTTGTPIALLIHNENTRSEDYSEIANAFRPSHADYTYEKKYGLRDPRGGGRSSARETAVRVAAGAIAKQLLKAQGIHIHAYVCAVGDIEYQEIPETFLPYEKENIVRCPDSSIAQQMIHKIEDARDRGDSLGGCIRCVALGVPPGLGEPLYNKLHAALGSAMLSINACKGIEFGSGFEGSKMYGSEHNDAFYVSNRTLKTYTNHSGGIQGGISNGEPIIFKAAFKPVATLMQKVSTFDSDLKEVVLSGKGRHDPCVLPRAVPIVEAMTAIVLLDHWLIRNAYL